MAEYELLLHSPVGVRLRELRPNKFTMVRRVNEVGKTTLILPDKAGYSYSEFARDQIVTIARSLPGSGSYLEGETLWFVRGRAWSDAGLEIALEDANTILRRRIVAYAAGTSQASKSGAVDNMILAIMRENFGTLAPTGRNVSESLDIQANVGLGVSVEKGFAWRRVLDVIRELAAASEEAGVFCGFDVVCSQSPLPAVAGSMTFGLEFRVFTQQRGIDHRWPGGSPAILIGSELGSLRDPRISETWSDEESYVYAGGEGQNEQRLIGTAQKDSVINASLFGRIEGFRDVSRVKTVPALQDEASAQLAAKAGRVKVTGKFQETEHVRWGEHVRFGDFVTVQEAGVRVDVRLNAEQITVSRNGETIDAALEGGY